MALAVFLQFPQLTRFFVQLARAAAERPLAADGGTEGAGCAAAGIRDIIWPLSESEKKSFIERGLT